MPFTVEVKLTSELTESERTRICALFADVFHRPFPVDLFRRKYSDAYTGNALHCLAVDGEIAGTFSAIMFRYTFFDRECIFAIAIDLMLEDRYRPNVGLMRRMSQALYRRLADEGVAFVFSCVREEMMRFHQVVGGWRNIGRLSHYVAPLRGPHIPAAGALLRALVRATNALRAPRSGEIESPIQKVNDDEFRAYRYTFFDTEYRSLKLGEGQAVYTGRTFWPVPGVPKNIRLSFLVDVWPLRQKVLDTIVRKIAQTQSDLDYLVYTGCLAFRPKRMWKVPDRLERPRYFLGGRILRPDLIDERVYEIANWRINLSDTDLI